MRSIFVLAMVAAALPTATQAAQCAERPGGLYFLGRSPDSAKSYWLSATNQGSYRLSAPGVPDIDAWSVSTGSVHMSVSSVVKDDVNGTHYLDRMNADGGFDCFLHSRNQVHPLLPPMWRPPVRPTLPVAVRPALPDRPAVIRPQLPDRPAVVRPTRPDPPVVVELDGLRQELRHGQLIEQCPMARFDSTGTLDQASIQDCTELVSALRQAPLTPGRDLMADSPWNAWVDSGHVHSQNERGVADVTERAGTISFGVDRQVRRGLAAGVLMAVNHQRSESFWGHVSSDARGWAVGPYAAMQLSSTWTLFGAALVGQTRREHQVLSLDGVGNADQCALTLNAQGEHALSETETLRPKIGIAHLKEVADPYLLRGVTSGGPVEVLVSGRSRDSGQVQASVEWSTSMKGEVGPSGVAYLEVGAINNYLRDEGAQVPRWQGLLRGGWRSLISREVQVDVSAGHQSLGVSHLSIWDVRLFMAFAF